MMIKKSWKFQTIIEIMKVREIVGNPGFGYSLFSV